MDSLPEEVQDLLYSPEMYGAVRQVSLKHKIHVDQMDLLETETAQVMLGFTQTVDFPKAVAQSLKVDAVQAEAIAKDIDETLFVKIREAMKHSDQKTAPATQSISNPLATSVRAPEEKSVVMPSAAKAPVPVVTTPTLAQPAAPAATISAPTATPAVPEIIKPVGLPMIEHVDTMLSQPTVSIAPKPTMQTVPASAPAVPAATTPTPVVDVKKSDTPAPPPIYKTDPYHEPID